MEIKVIRLQLFCLRRVIAGKESRGEDARKEIDYLKHWLKDPEFSEADKLNQRAGVYAIFSGMADKSHSVSLPTGKGIIPTDNNNALDFDFETHSKAGRPKASGELSRTTAWRRRREEKQGVLIPALP